MTKTEWMRRFNVTITRLLEERQMSNLDLAKASGLSTSAISEYINQHKIPGGKAILNMAYALDISVNELVDFGEYIE